MSMIASMRRNELALQAFDHARETHAARSLPAVQTTFSASEIETRDARQRALDAAAADAADPDKVRQAQLAADLKAIHR